MAMVQVSSVSVSLAIIVVIGGWPLVPWTPAMLIAACLCSRLTRNVDMIDVIDVFLESIRNLGLLLLSLAAMMVPMSLLSWIGLLLVVAIICCLSSSLVSAVTIEVFLGCLSTNFSCALL